MRLLTPTAALKCLQAVPPPLWWSRNLCRNIYSPIKILDKNAHFFDICLFIYCDILNIVGYLQDGFLILDMFDLLEPDHVVDGEDLEGEVFPTGPIPTQADTSKGTCKNKKFTFK